MARRSDPERRLTDTLLRTLSKKPWRDVSLVSLARSAKVALPELARWAPAKPDLIGLVLRRFGDEVAIAYKPGRRSDSSHDRLFDASMAWLDALAPHKRAIRALYHGLRNDPLTLLASRNAILAAAQWLMTLAEADKGPALSVRATVYAAILGRAISVWLDDDSEMTRTMAQLDGDLRRASEAFRFTKGRSHR